MSNDTQQWPVWPLPSRPDLRPVLLVDDDDTRVGIAYARVPDVRLVHSTRLSGLGPFHLPADTPVFAVDDGLVAHAGRHGTGYRIVVEHPFKWLSYYSDLDRLVVQPQANVRTVVKRGDIIGYAGHETETRPLRFELWVLNYDIGYIPIDPIRFMHRWTRLPPAPSNHVMQNTA